MQATADDSIKIRVRAPIPQVKAAQELWAGRVRDYFKRNLELPAKVVLCYFAADDSLQRYFGGPENRGFQGPLEHGSEGFPADVRRVAVEVSADSIVYLHASTCRSDLGLTMTFAHELQHFLQYWNERDLWTADWLFKELVRNEMLKPWQTPAEIEARIVAKKVAIDLYGRDPVEKFIAERIEEPVTPRDRENWQFVQSLDPSDKYNLAEQSKLFVRRHKRDLKRVLGGAPRPGSNVDLDSEFWDD